MLSCLLWIHQGIHTLLNQDVPMTFKEATDRLTAGVSLSDVAVALDRSAASIRRARLAPKTASYRNPPEGWEPAVAKLARKSANDLNRLAAELGPRPRRTIEELDLVVEHLQYEVGMLLATAKALASRRFGTEVPADQPIHNALVESFAIHARNVLHFLDPTGAKASDVLAEDFLADPRHWKRERGALPQQLESVRRRVGKQVAHLTYDRSTTTPDDREWKYLEIGKALARRYGRWTALMAATDGTETVEAGE